MADEQVLDVSQMEAPEPLVESIRALGALSSGQWLHLYHRMKPCKLYDYMEQHGYQSITCRGSEIACEVFIWRVSDNDAANAAQAIAATLPIWKDE